jgi:hypothetical protein
MLLEFSDLGLRPHTRICLIVVRHTEGNHACGIVFGPVFPWRIEVVKGKKRRAASAAVGVPDGAAEVHLST